MHDDAVLEICCEYVRRYTQVFTTAGADGGGGDKSGNFSWSPHVLLSRATYDLLYKTQNASKARITIKRSFTY